MSQTVVFDVEMACAGCSGATTKILGKIEGGEVRKIFFLGAENVSRLAGIDDVDANLETQKITVKYDDPATPEDMLEKLQKWGTAAKKKVALAA